MLTFACVNVGDYCGRGQQYVDVLFDMTKRAMPSETPFRFVCFTDDPGTTEGVEYKPVPSDLRGWWAKLFLFSTGAFEPGTRVVYFDLDTIVTGPLADIIAYDGDFAILRDAYRPNGWQSAVMCWKAGAVDYIWMSWRSAGMPEVSGGDQAWIEMVVPEADILQEKYPGQLASFKVECLTGPPVDARVVFFHGQPKPHDFASGWVADFWRIGGLTAPQLDLVCNTKPDAIAANVKAALARNRPELALQSDPIDKAVAIVGGGPSVASHVDTLRRHKEAGGTIWALNGAGNWLIRNGIVPDAIWIVDARPENAAFIPESGDATLFLASQCAPEVFDTASGCNVVLWHSESCKELLPEGVLLIGVGSTVLMKAIGGAFASGYRDIALYGVDSSFAEDMHHAYQQPLNDRDEAVVAVVYGVEFSAAPWMLQQVTDFQAAVPVLVGLGCRFTVHGDGLLPTVARHMDRGEPAHKQRARAILSRLMPGETRGAEIGVFTGALSGELLNWPGMELLMVDAWEGGTTSYAEPDGAGDWHCNLTQEQQDEYRRHAETVAAITGRGTVIAKRSVDAALDVPDGSLDFVFIDADHSYAGCKADIEAWYPKLKPGGLLSGHDFDNPGFPKFGVTRAVTEFAAAHGLGVDLGDNFTWFLRLPTAARKAA